MRISEFFHRLTISHMVPSLAAFIVRRRVLLVATTVTLGIALAALSPQFKARHSVDDFFVDTTENGQFLQSFRTRFPQGEFFVVAYDDLALFTETGLNRLKAITADAENIPEIKEVKSLANVTDIISSDEAFEVRPFLDTIPKDPRALERLKERAVTHPLYEKRLVSPDGTTAAVVIFVQDPPPDDGYRMRVLENTQRALQPHREAGVQFTLAGWTVTNAAVLTYMKEDLRRFLPVTFILVALVVWFVFRSARFIAFAMANVVLTVLATLGFSSLCGFSLNVVSSIAIPLVMALALTDTVHIFTHLDRRLLERYPSAAEAMEHILKDIFRPSFITSLNTALGFFSLTFSQTPAIREFGWMGTAGMVFEFIFSFGFLAPSLLFLDPKHVFRKVGTDSDNRIIAGFLLWVNRSIQRFPLPIFLGGMILFAAGIWSSRNLVLESDLLAFFPKNDPMTLSIQKVEKSLGGVGLLEISVKGEGAGAFKEPKNLVFLEELQAFLGRQPSIDKTLSLTDYIKEMHVAFHAGDPAYRKVPDRRPLVEQYLLLYSGDELDDFVSGDYSEARLTVRTHDHRTTANARLIKALGAFAREEAPAGLTVRSTGEIQRAVDSVQVYMRDQIQSLGLAVVLIWAVMAVVLKSIPLSLLFLLPNLFPIAVNFGVMAWAGIPLDTGTLLISSCAFGVVVDDTVHYFIALRERRLNHMPIRQAVQEVLLKKGESTTSSFLILGVAFGALLVGHFVPVFEFARLNILILVVGAIGDLFIMNSLLLLTARKKYQTPYSSLPAPETPEGP